MTGRPVLGYEREVEVEVEAGVAAGVDGASSAQMADDTEGIEAALVVVSALALLVAAIGLEGPVATLLVGGYLVIGPGLAATLAAGLPASLRTAAMAIPLSICISGLVAAGLLVSGAYQPIIALLVVVFLTLTLVLVERIHEPPP